MRAGLELTALGLDRGGSARYARGLTAALRARGDLELVELGHEGRGGRIARGLARELVWFPFALGRRARAAEVDLLHCLSPNMPARAPVPLVATIHDVLAWVHPEWLTAANVLQHRLVVERGLRRAGAVVVPSQFTARELVGRLGVPAERVVVAPIGVDAAFAPGERGPEDYVLVVGTLQPRKNLAAAVEALARSGLPHRLVVAGAAGWAGPAPAGVDWRGFVGEDELVALYRGAACLLFPSLYEGFGLPALEAMACGTPVIATARTSLPEVVGDAGLLVEPDAAAMAAALRELLGDDALRAELRERGLRRAREFSWARCAERVAGAYELAVRGRSARSPAT